MFDRGFQYLFFAQQATAPHQGDLFSDWVLSLPEGQRPTTAPIRHRTTRSPRR